MKKTILMLLMTTMLVIVNAKDTTNTNSQKIQKVTITSNMFGVEFGAPIMGRGLINPNVTIPQRIAYEYYIVHYLSMGYSFLEGKKDEYLLSYGIGIPLIVSSKGTLYGYFIDAYHYRPDLVITDPTKNRDFRQRRLRLAYRVNNFEFSTTYTLRHSAILGISYSFKK
jgi:hypothetical protein